MSLIGISEPFSGYEAAGREAIEGFCALQAGRTNGNGAG
jgi:hypothetical protein